MSTLRCAECGGDHPTALCTTRVPASTRPPLHTPGRVALGLGGRIGNYALTRLLGGGSTSEVFLGENEVSQAVAAVKVLRPVLHGDRQMVRRFESEARTTNLVRHEHVVEIYDIGLHDSWQHFIVLEHLDGQTLARMLDRPMDQAAAIRIVLQLCSALGTAHSKGVVHRDLKPANVFVLQREGQSHVKLVDFGMARREQLREGEDRTRIGTIVGTAAFMSPEQTLGLECDGRSDIYSLGVLMFRMATGRLPFESDSAVEAMVAHAQEPPPAPRGLNPDITPAYEEVILKCLAKSPSDRWQSTAAVGRAIAAAVRAGPAVKPSFGGSLALVPAPQPSPRVDIGRDPSMLPTPAEGKPAVRRQPRVRTTFGVQVFAGLGALVGDAVVSDISMGGAFVRSSIALPLFSRIRLVGSSSAGRLDVTGELVRLVISDPASRGFGVRFDSPNPEQVKILEALTRSRTVEDGTENDPYAEAELQIFESRLDGDSYEMIGVPNDASTRRIRDVCERLSEEMALRNFPRLSQSQAQRLVEVTRRLTEAEEVLIDPSRRALNDAVNGNVLGVLRCITEGLPLEQLDALRVEFIKSRPDAEALARPALASAAHAERAGDVSAALSAIADALCHDPLNLGLHRKAAELRGLRRTTPTLPWGPAAPRP